MHLTRAVALALLSLAALIASVTTASSSGPGNILFSSSFGVPGQAYTFDYLVIGGGNAGLAIAARLAENSSLLIGVVEAGSFYEISNGNLSVIPGLDIHFVGKDPNDWQPLIDWGFVTTPQNVRC